MVAAMVDVTAEAGVRAATRAWVPIALDYAVSLCAQRRPTTIGAQNILVLASRGGRQLMKGLCQESGLLQPQAPTA